MSDTTREADLIRDTFRMDRVPAFVARTLYKAPITVAAVNCRKANNGMTQPIPEDDAFLLNIQLIDCPAHDMWLDGKPIRTEYLRAGTSNLYDLKQLPVCNSISPFSHINLYLPRASINLIATTEGLSAIECFRHDCGAGMMDETVARLANCLVPSFERPDEACALFVDHVTVAITAHIVKSYGQGGARTTTRRPASLSRKQLGQVMDQLDANLDGDLTLAALTSDGEPSPLSVAEGLRGATGRFPHQWIAVRRLEKAQQYLRHRSHLSLEYIAVASGYRTEGHFVRSFIRAMGVHPALWRAQQ